MLAWWELITDVRKPEIMVMTSLWRAIYWLLRSPSQTCHAKPKIANQQALTLPAFPVGGMPTASSYRKTSLRKTGRCGIAADWRCVALYLWLIVVISQAIDRCSNIWASLPGAGYGQFEHKADSLIAKFKEAGGTVREIDVWAESPRLFLLWLSASSSACHGLHNYRDNAITYKAQRDKNARELKLANAAITDMQMRQRDVAALDAKIHEGVSWC